MRYTVDEALCAGHGKCFRIAPTVFGPAEDGINRDAGRIGETTDDQARRVTAAARSCPEQAIRVLDPSDAADTSRGVGAT